MRLFPTWMLWISHRDRTIDRRWSGFDIGRCENRTCPYERAVIGTVVRLIVGHGGSKMNANDHYLIIYYQLIVRLDAERNDIKAK
jgi:hypothetical protein